MRCSEARRHKALHPVLIKGDVTRVSDKHIPSAGNQAISTSSHHGLATCACEAHPKQHCAWYVNTKPSLDQTIATLAHACPLNHPLEQAKSNSNCKYMSNESSTDSHNSYMPINGAGVACAAGVCNRQLPVLAECGR